MTYKAGDKQLQAAGQENFSKMETRLVEMSSFINGHLQIVLIKMRIYYI